MNYTRTGADCENLMLTKDKKFYVDLNCINYLTRKTIAKELQAL